MYCLKSRIRLKMKPAMVRDKEGLFVIVVREINLSYVLFGLPYELSELKRFAFKDGRSDHSIDHPLTLQGGFHNESESTNNPVRTKHERRRVGPALPGLCHGQGRQERG